MAANHSLEEIRSLPQCRLAALPFAGRHGAGHGLAGKRFLHGLLRWKLSGPFEAGVDKHSIERRNGHVHSLADSLAEERAQIKLL